MLVIKPRLAECKALPTVLLLYPMGAKFSGGMLKVPHIMAVSLQSGHSKVLPLYPNNSVMPLNSVKRMWRLAGFNRNISGHFHAP